MTERVTFCFDIFHSNSLLGHEHIDTTLAYARLYDRTVVADYYRAMSEVKGRMEMGEGGCTAAHPT